MNVITKFLEQYSYRFPKGYPDVTNLEDKALLYKILEELNVVSEAEENADEITAEEVKNLIDQIKDNPQKLKYIKKYILKKSSEGDLNSYLSSRNIDSSTFSEYDLPELMTTYLENSDSLEAFQNYTQNPISFSSLGQSGNLVDELSSATNISSNVITRIVNLKGTEGGRGIGKGEVALATFIKDLKMSPGKGDLDWNGKYLEVKASGARLGSRGNNPSLLTNSNLAKMYNNEENQVSPKTRLDILIYDLTEQDVNIQDVVKSTKELLNQIYPDAKNIDQNITPENLTSIEKIKKALVKVYINNYASKEGVDHFIFLNTEKAFGNYISFSPNEADDLVDNGWIGTTSFQGDNLTPQLKKP
jgi:hypothetical protein